jgi:hypothetical protein
MKTLKAMVLEVPRRSAYELQGFDLQNGGKGGHHQNQSPRGEECLALGDLDGVGRWTKTVKAEEAERIGFVHRVAPPREINGRIIGLGQRDCKRIRFDPCWQTIDVPGFSEFLSGSLGNRFRTVRRGLQD